MTERPPLTRPELLEYGRGAFFIVGNSRGGTTLLQAILTSHSDITIPPETHYLFYLPDLKKKFGAALPAAQLDAIVEELFANRRRARDFGIEMDEVKASFRSAGRSYEDLLLVMMALYARERGKPRCGEKTPRHLLKVPELNRAFPEARFITLLRDPRAVAASELKADYASPSVYVCARRWRRSYDVHMALSRALPARLYTMVRYEDLVREPEPTTKELCRFLGVEFEPSMMRYYERSDDEMGYPEGETWKRKTRSPIDPARIEAWRDQLTAAQIAIVERTVGPRMEKLGYRPDGASDGIGARELATAWVADVWASLKKTLIKKLFSRF